MQPDQQQAVMLTFDMLWRLIAMRALDVLVWSPALLVIGLVVAFAHAKWSAD